MSDAPLVEVDDVVMHYPAGRRGKVVHALDGVSLTVHPGETLGLVGESGSGKSTLGRLLLALEAPTSGVVRFDGAELSPRTAAASLRREMQMVFQDPHGSLNPRKRIGRILADVLEVHAFGDTAAIRGRVDELLDLVGLPPDRYHERYPHELSGGQRQRVGIARAVALHPKLVVADEPVSALDVSIQAQIMNLLSDLREQFGLTYVLIAHDLGVVRQMADRVAVLYLGKLVETAPRDALYARPLHPYTEALLEAVPVADPAQARRERVVLGGDPPDPTDPPSGCRFRTRCPYAQDVCAAEEPPLDDHPGGRTVACHFPRGAP